MNLPPEQMESARNGRFHLKITQIGIEIHASNSIRVSRTSAPDVLKVSTVKAIQSKKNQRRPRFSDRRGWVEAAVLRFWINGFQCICHCISRPLELYLRDGWMGVVVHWLTLPCAAAFAEMPRILRAAKVPDQADHKGDAPCFLVEGETI